MAAMAMVDQTTSLSLVAAARALRDALSGFEPALVSGEDAAKGVEVLSRTEKICAAKRAQLASRAAECGAHREAGYSRPTEWMARATGTTAGQAPRDLELAAVLDDHPETRPWVLIRGGRGRLGQVMPPAWRRTHALVLRHRVGDGPGVGTGHRR